MMRLPAWQRWIPVAGGVLVAGSTLARAQALGAGAGAAAIATGAASAAPTPAVAATTAAATATTESTPAARGSATPVAAARAKPAAAATAVATPAPIEGYRAAQPDAAARVLEDAVDLIQQEYVDGGITREELVEAALKGIVDHLNKRAVRSGQAAVNSVLTRRDVGRLADSMSGQQSGLGVLARSAPDGLEVIQVVDDSPAMHAGLRRGDRIVAVDDHTVSPGDDLFPLLRGEDGTTVRLEVVRGAETSDPQKLTLKVVRGKFHISSVASRMLDGDIGYVRISSFMHGTADDVAGEILSLREAGAWGLILDLRGNPGGSLEEAMRVAGMFVDPGQPLLQIVGRSGVPQTIDSEGERLWFSSVSALVDSSTASASEALASALHGHGALVIGSSRKTAGKGLGESIFGLAGGAALRLATARYRSAEGVSWEGIGVKVDFIAEPISLEPGARLDPAVELAVNIMTRAHPQNVAAPTPNSDAYPAALLK